MVGDEKKKSKISRANGVPRGTAQVGLVGCASGHSADFPDKRAHSRGTRICAMSRILFLGCASGHTASWPGWPANGFWTVPPYIPQKWPVGPGWPELKLGLVCPRTSFLFFAVFGMTYFVCEVLENKNILLCVAEVCFAPMWCLLML